MGLLAKIGEAVGGGSKSNQDWNSSQQSSSSNEFSMPDPNLKGMAVGETATIPVLEPIAKLTETAVKLKEKEAKDWKEQEQLHGRNEAAKTSVFNSHANISVAQFQHGKKRVKLGLSAREKGATQFGEYLFSSARPEFISQNYRVQLSQRAGEQIISRLGQEYNQAVNDLNDYTEAM
jgi:hypothetical protein